MYTDLSDEDMLELAIRFVAQNQPLPPAIEARLRELELYDLIVNPGGYE